MNAAPHQFRRAILDDLPGLRQLWELHRLPVTMLEPHLTEFQVAAAADGTLIACLGLQIESQQGHVHSAACRSPEIESALRSPLWGRVQAVARNHGLVRLWTQESSPFWRSNGFLEADEHLLKKLPGRFGDAKGPWLALQLREEVAAAVSLEHEFELFKQAQKEMSDKVLNQARTLRFMAGVVAVLVFLLSIWAVWYLVRKLPVLKKHLNMPKP